MDAGGKTQLATRLLGLWVWLPPGGECYVLSREVFFDGSIPRPEESYRIVCACVRACVCMRVTECD